MALRQTNQANGYPFVPTGDPMKDGVGPASWAARRDVAELDAHGHPKIIPMSRSEKFFVAAGRDPRGLPVVAGDGKIVGMINDMWMNQNSWSVILNWNWIPHWAMGRLVPMTMARIHSNRVVIKSIFAEHFNDVPAHRSENQITMLEEERSRPTTQAGHFMPQRRD